MLDVSSLGKLSPPSCDRGITNEEESPALSLSFFKFLSTDSDTGRLLPSCFIGDCPSSPGDLGGVSSGLLLLSSWDIPSGLMRRVPRGGVVLSRLLNSAGGLSMSDSFEGEVSLPIPSVFGGGREGVGSGSRSTLDLSNFDSTTLAPTSSASIFGDTPTSLMTSLLQLSRLLVLPLVTMALLEREVTCGCCFKDKSFEVDAGPANLESFGLERGLPVKEEGGVRLEADDIFFKGAVNLVEGG